jgi:hypothetical protein
VCVWKLELQPSSVGVDWGFDWADHRHAPTSKITTALFGPEGAIRSGIHRNHGQAWHQSMGIKRKFSLVVPQHKSCDARKFNSRLGAAIKLIPSFVLAVLGCKPSPTPVLLHRGTNRSLL